MRSSHQRTLRPRSNLMRKGFTLIELIIVISISGMLAATAFPSIKNSMNRGNVNIAVSLLADLHAKAQQLARRATDEIGGPWYSVRLRMVGGTQIGEVLLGDAASTSVVMSRKLPGSLTVMVANDASGINYAAAPTIQWWYIPMTGMPSASYGTYTPVNVGTPQQAAQPASNQITFGISLPLIPQSPIASGLALSDRSGIIRAGVAVYDCGLCNAVVY